jgi:hypothetical protein
MLARLDPARVVQWLGRRAVPARLAIIAATVVGVVVVAGAAAMAAGVVPRVFFADASSPAAVPVNDDFADAAAVSGTIVSGTTAGATTEAAEVSANEAAAGDQTVWFSWTPTAPGITQFVPSADGSPAVHVYTGSSVGSLTRVELPPDSGGDPTDITSVAALAGTQYLVQVDAPAGTAGGAFSFSVDQPEPGAPANDAVAQAQALDAGVVGVAGGGAPVPIVGATAGATTEPGEPGVAGPAAHSVWYSLGGAGSSLPAGSHLSLTATSLTGSPLGLRLGWFQGADAAHLTLVAADQAGTLTVTTTAGTTALIAVEGPEAFFALAESASNVPAPDVTPPDVHCTPPTGWVQAASVPCTATDGGSGLAHAADASFTLDVAVPPGAALADAESSSRQVCDQAGNCTTAGPFENIQVDTSAPAVTCAPPPPGWASAAVSVGCTANDDGSGLAGGQPATFTLTADVAAGTTSDHVTFPDHAPVCDAVGNCSPVPAPAPTKIDENPPVLACAAPPTGWSAVEVGIACTATDSGSGLATTGQATFQLTTSVGDEQADPNASTNTVSVCDQAGNCATAGPVNGLHVDRSLPVVTCTPPDGWTAGTSVSVPCTASDDGSGLAASSPASFSLTATIPAGTESSSASTDSRPVCDAAGNCATAGPVTGLELDDAAPTITCGVTPGDWSGAAVHVGCASSDDGAGLANAGDATFDLVADAPAGRESDSVAVPSRQVCDAVGHCVTTPPLVPAKIDHAPPTATCDPVPSGTSTTEVDVKCHAIDGGSGLADPSQATFHLRTSVGAGNVDHQAQTGSENVCDAVNNCVVAGPFIADVDLSRPSGAAPTIDFPHQVGVLAAVAAPSPGHDAATVTVPYAVPGATGGTGSVQVACDPPPGSTFQLGLTPVNCGATDDADQTTEGTFWVTVAAAPSLAPTGPAVAGQPWRAVGADFAPGSAVTIELDGSVIDRATAGADGTVSEVVTMPASLPLGPHELVVRGSDANASPLLVVTPVTMAVPQLNVAPPPTTTPPTTTPPITTVPPTTAPPVGSGGGSGGGSSGAGGSSGGAAAPGAKSGGAAAPVTTAPTSAGNANGGSSTGSPAGSSAGGQTTGGESATPPGLPSAPAAPSASIAPPPTAPPPSPSGGAPTTSSGTNEQAAGPTTPAAGGPGAWPWLLALLLLAAIGVTALVVWRRGDRAPL